MRKIFSNFVCFSENPNFNNFRYYVIQIFSWLPVLWAIYSCAVPLQNEFQPIPRCFLGLISDRDKSDRCCVATPAFKKHDLLANDLSESLSFLIILQRLDAGFNGNYSQILKIYYIWCYKVLDMFALGWIKEKYKKGS